LFAAAKAILDMSSGTVAVTFTTPHDFQRQIETLRTRLGEKAFAANWAMGEAMTRERAIEYALAPDTTAPVSTPVQPTPAMPSPSTSPNAAGLTTREVDVLRLLALGYSYAQIAEQLVVSRRTINSHLTSIYSKLGVTSRAAATRYATDHHLV
jgi:DNA-binding NarL/FixJ family response regulator